MQLLQIFLQVSTEEQEPKLWGISNDGWFTGIVPVLIFFLGYIVNKWIEKRKEKKRLHDLESYFKQTLFLLNEPVSKQIAALIRMSHFLKQGKEQHIYLDFIASFKFDQTNEINKQDLYNIFINRKKGSIIQKATLYGQLKSSLDYLDIISTTLKKEIIEFQTHYNEYEKTYKENLALLESHFNAMILDFRLKGEQPDLFLVELHNIRKKWFESNNLEQSYTDMYVAIEKYLEKYRELCIKNMNDPRAVNAITNIMGAKYAFNNIVESKKVFRRIFLLQARGIQSHWRKINKVLQKFDSTFSHANNK